MEEKLLKANEVATMLGVNKLSVYHYVHEKHLPAVRISKKCLRFRRSDVLEWIEQKKVKTQK